MSQITDTNRPALWLLLIMIAAMPFVFYTGPDSFIIPRTLLLHVGVWIIVILIALRPPENVSNLKISLILFVLVNLIAVLLSGNILLTLKPWVYFLSCTVLAWSVSVISVGPGRLEKICLAIIIPGLIMSVHGILQYFHYDHSLLSGVAHSFRVFATAGTPAALAGYLVVCLCLSFGFLARCKTFSGMALWTLAWLFFIACLGVTFSRSGLVAAAISLAFSFFLFIFTARAGFLRIVGRTLLCLVLLIAAVTAVTLYEKHQNTDRNFSLNPIVLASDYYDSKLKSESVLLRAFTLRASENMIRSAPVRGRGPGSFAFYYPETQARLLKDEPYIQRFGNVVTHRLASHAHNEYAEIAVESGIPGLLCFLLIICTALSGLFRANIHENETEYSLIVCAAGGALLGLIVHACFEFTLHFPLTGMLFMVLAGACAGSRKIQSIPSHASGPAFNIKRALTIAIALIILLNAPRPFLAMKNMMNGVQYASEQQFDPAMKFLNRAAVLDPTIPDIYLNRSGVHIARGEPKPALSNVDRAITLTRRPEVFMRRSLLLLLTGRAAEAEQAARKAMSIDPWMPHPHFQLARILLAQYKLAEAIRELHTTLELDPSFEPARTLLEAISEDVQLHIG